MSYQRMLSEQFDLDGIRAAGIRVVHDAMYGAGQGVLLDLLGPDHVLELHPDPDPDFGGTPPEPIERNLTEMRATVKGLGYAAGIANDGDADRIGMCDEEGRFVDSHRLLALLLRYLHEDLGMSGEVVKTVSTTDMIDVMGRAYGLTVHTTPIGFKHISGLFLERDVLIGGEESGGIAVKGHVPDRDGIYVGIMILEMMASHGKSLSELVEELYAEFGRYDYHREDLHTTDTAMERVLDRLQSAGGLTEIAGRAVLDVDRLDGYKHRMKNGWLLIRPSGTEPVLRIYSESRDAALAEASVRDAIRQLALHSA
jgi:phosphomannomutase